MSRAKAIGLAMFLSGGLAQAAEPLNSAVPPKELQAKIAYCKTCHGNMGQGYRGATTAPRLAGQQIEYLQNQLKAFIDKRRQNRFMYGVAHVLTPDMITALASYFNGLNPKPVGGGNPELAAEGKKIFTDGLLKAQIPPCSSCHGDDAKGNGLFPRLAGQLPEYVTRNLAAWDKDRGQDPKNPDNSAIMAPIAHNLSAAQVSAVAAYLATLE